MVARNLLIKIAEMKREIFKIRREGAERTPTAILRNDKNMKISGNVNVAKTALLNGGYSDKVYRIFPQNENACNLMFRTENNARTTTSK